MWATFNVGKYSMFKEGANIAVYIYKLQNFCVELEVMLDCTAA